MSTALDHSFLNSLAAELNAAKSAVKTLPQAVQKLDQLAAKIKAQATATASASAGPGQTAPAAAPALKGAALVERYMSLAGAERRAFFVEHEAALWRAHRASLPARRKS